ncbi:NUDIX domain-containing protein [Streptomyces sp. RFCAC02]|uniref:NUDIX hydrolase n=1 Tax=Streptomyces sp. RFCAC02 TaxID=2499143 RepID=UPI001021A7E2|nr:NUDIX domain-containing protein [Streptomyces sp. RFCAC02]
MQHRVRAVLLTPNDTMLVMRRIRPGVAPYSVIVGGKVEPADAGPEDALLREVREEIAGEPRIVSLLHTLVTGDERQDFYLATIERWSFEDRCGPEFSQEGRGEYILQEIPLTTEAIDAANLLPPEIAAVLRDAVEQDEPFSAAFA